MAYSNVTAYKAVVVMGWVSFFFSPVQAHLPDPPQIPLTGEVKIKNEQDLLSQQSREASEEEEKEKYIPPESPTPPPLYNFGKFKDEETPSPALDKNEDLAKK